MAKSEVRSATCITLASSNGSLELFASFSWCFLRFEGVIQPSSSEVSDSEAWTSSTEGSDLLGYSGVVVAFSTCSGSVVSG